MDSEETSIVRRHLTVTGVVQGVGFRPFVHKLADTYGLAGWVGNTSFGVVIEVEGPDGKVEAFLKDLRGKCPPLGRIDDVVIVEQEPSGEGGFTIPASDDSGDASAEIPPDAALCKECEKEMLDSSDRRYRYPFINCTQCGPRFTIVEEVPYDRPRTTMRNFQMCRDCRTEYTDPRDRRFHAEPVACPVCGPALQWLSPQGVEGARGEDALKCAVDVIASGGIVALKGLGGFHLVCDATNKDAVRKLRSLKDRPGKPFAVMSRSLEDIEKYAILSDEDRVLLSSLESPITLVHRKPECILCEEIAPGLLDLGVMTAYTPLHVLLFESGKEFPALVMTSGNHRDEPIARTNEEALKSLRGIVDGFLVHNRPIHNRADDSIARVLRNGDKQILRRARGYCPRSIAVNIDKRVFAAGPELKNTFCLTRPGEAILSQHIGDLNDERSLEFYSETFEKHCRLLDLEPEIVCCDLHPDYLSTRFAEDYALSRNLPLVRVQHHEAHIASVVAEYPVLETVESILGASLDGTGYGTDGTIWGGEFLLFEGTKVTRTAHLDPFFLPGGDTAIRKVWRSGLSLLYTHGIYDQGFGFLAGISADERETVVRMMRKRTNCPTTSSAGRLFDGVAVLAGFGPSASYEAEAAMLLEAACGKDFSPYPIVIEDGPPARIMLEPIVRGIISDLEDIPRLSSRFHATMAHIVLEVARKTRDSRGTTVTALSGGVFQNRVLLELTRQLLSEDGFKVFINRLVPPNDGGISLRQVYLASRRKDDKSCV